MINNRHPTTALTHTPGPWTVHNVGGSGYGKQFHVFTPKGKAFTGNQLDPKGTSIGEARKNATLAAAAPDLLAALEWIAAHAYDGNGTWGETPIVKEALAKARG